MIFCLTSLKNLNNNQNFAEFSFKWFLIAWNRLNLVQFTKYTIKKKKNNYRMQIVLHSIHLNAEFMRVKKICHLHRWKFQLVTHELLRKFIPAVKWKHTFNIFIIFKLTYFLIECWQNTHVFQIQQKFWSNVWVNDLKCSIFISELRSKNDFWNICIQKHSK